MQGGIFHSVARRDEPHLSSVVQSRDNSRESRIGFREPICVIEFRRLSDGRSATEPGSGRSIQSTEVGIKISGKGGGE